MAKVVFCNIAWMKLYSGITDNDQPKNGGAFVKENNDACESFNFYPYNQLLPWVCACTRGEVESGACRGCAR